MFYIRFCTDDNAAGIEEVIENGELYSCDAIGSEIEQTTSLSGVDTSSVVGRNGFFAFRADSAEEAIQYALDFSKQKSADGGLVIDDRTHVIMFDVPEEVDEELIDNGDIVCSDDEGGLYYTDDDRYTEMPEAVLCDEAIIELINKGCATFLPIEKFMDNPDCIMDDCM